MCSHQPEVLWAQRSEKVYLTISLPDAKDVSLKCEPNGVFNFSAVGVHGDSFSVTLQLYGNISPECKTNIGLRNILCPIQKEQKGWWPRLLKSEEKPAPYLKVDWNKWCDEDDEEYSDSDDDGVAKMMKAAMMEECSYLPDGFFPPLNDIYIAVDVLVYSDYLLAQKADKNLPERLDEIRTSC
ncbi:hypothetical protein RND71_036048 [Anisodus tanguticus]|uniref:Co-chaperone protein p23 n=1 Tax=Anisodus tanguticus TaxID=243964 RepID=A0AAE1R8S6_9SOLA|nr:hypothetical protein RND71_036048 [Anisodus tanguticus]